MLLEDLGNGSSHSGLIGLIFGILALFIDLVMTVLPYIMRSKFAWAIFILGVIGYYIFGGVDIIYSLSDEAPVGGHSSSSE